MIKNVLIAALAIGLLAGAAPAFAADSGSGTSATANASVTTPKAKVHHVKHAGKHVAKAKVAAKTDVKASKTTPKVDDKEGNQ